MQRHGNIKYCMRSQIDTSLCIVQQIGEKYLILVPKEHGVDMNMTLLIIGQKNQVASQHGLIKVYIQ